MRAALPLALLPVVLGLAGCAARVPTSTPTVAVDSVGTDALLIGVGAAGEAVWAAGSKGTWARSLDGGRTWTTGTVPGADSLQFRDVAAFSAREALLLSIGNGGASRVYTTDDGGATWALRWTNPEPEAFYDCVAFFDRARGFAFSDAVGERIPIIETADGGRTWRNHEGLRARPGEGGYASSGTCAVAGPDGRGWVVTNGGDGPDRVFRTEDFGRTWVVRPAPVTSADPARGLATLAVRGRTALAGLLGDVDGVTVLASADGGRSWTRAPRTTIPRVYGVALAPGGAVAVGPEGLDARAGRGAWRALTATPFWGITALDDGTFVAVGPRGRVARVTF